MNIENIRFAVALNIKGKFDEKHFGDTHKFVIYRIKGNSLVEKEEIINKYRDADESSTHGSASKGESIAILLRDSEAAIVVSKQFGKNIKIIKNYFIPVIIYDEDRDSTLQILYQNINVLADELQNKTSAYNTYIIKNGLLQIAGKSKNL